MHPFDVSKENKVDDPCIKHGIFLLFIVPQLGHSATVVHNATMPHLCHGATLVPQCQCLMNNVSQLRHSPSERM